MSKDLLHDFMAANFSATRRAVAMSIFDHEIGKVTNQVKAPWFLEVCSF